MVPLVCVGGAAVALLPPRRVEARADGHAVHEVSLDAAPDTALDVSLGTAVTVISGVGVDGREGVTRRVAADTWM